MISLAMITPVPIKNPMLITKSLEGYSELVLTIACPLPAENPFLKDACLAIVAGLDHYNLEKTGPLAKRNIFYAEIPSSKMQVGNICHHSFSIDNHIDPDILEKIALSKPEFLTNLQAKAYEYGARRAFAWGYKNSKLAEIFLEAGFFLCGEFPDLENDRVIQRFYKDLDSSVDLNELSRSTITISDNYTYDSYQELNPYHSGLSHDKNSFGIFIYESANQILKGGIFGKILKAEDKGIPHGLIDCLWVHQCYRSKKLGTVLMEEAEDLFRQRGAKFIQLATNGFQAPEFYRKMGFDLSCSAPDYYALSDGYYDIFDCTKKL